MQDGFLFSDTIARNIALGTEEIDTNRLLYAVKMANIRSDIEELPLAYNTKIGASGIGLSQGQRQRILIARALYKNPQYLFFDEATNALDATNEKVIVENLNEVFKNKTVVIVAHRLSTVRNADQIVVLQKGVMVETGTHEELVALKGVYYHLIKNQLELGMD
jgi:ATP-binding cassette subfamily B protein